MSRLLVRALAVGTIASAFFHGYGAAAVQESHGILKGGTPKKIVLWDNDFATTTSESFIDVPNMKKALVTKTGLVHATFCSEAYADNNAIYVQVLIDNNPMLPGNEIQYESSSGYRSNANCYSWFSTVAKAGKHKIKVQYRSSTGDTIYLEQRSLTIEYN